MVTQTNELAMGYAREGEPFVYLQAQAAIDLKVMGYAREGEPFVTNDPATTGGAITMPSIANRLLMIDII
jgi:hypothetical protein